MSCRSVTAPLPLGRAPCRTLTFDLGLAPGRPRLGPCSGRRPLFHPALKEAAVGAVMRSAPLRARRTRRRPLARFRLVRGLLLVPPAGIEPATHGLGMSVSAVSRV